jgi:hypothetical protein
LILAACAVVLASRVTEPASMTLLTSLDLHRHRYSGHAVDETVKYREETGQGGLLKVLASTYSALRPNDLV